VTFASAPYNCADRLPCGKQGARDDTSDLTSDSHDCIHKSYFLSLVRSAMIEIAFDSFA
jgi:hypothetical protein